MVRQLTRLKRCHRSIESNFHHVYPRAHLKRLAAPEEHNSIINICMLAASETNAISDDDPKEYIPKCAGGLGTAKDVIFASNLLPLPDEFNYTGRSYGEFLAMRSATVAEFVAKLCDGGVH